MKHVQVMTEHGWLFISQLCLQSGGFLTTSNKDHALPPSGLSPDGDLPFFQSKYPERDFRLSEPLNG